MLKLSRGFTIVELLIVIVVIAILAAITIVSYTGIQNQAKNVQFLSSFDAYDKAFRNINTIDGSYPDSQSGTSIVSCMGDVSSYPDTAHLDEGQCYKYVDGATTVVFGVVNSAVNQRLLENISSLPGTKYKEASFQIGTATYWYRGIFYNTHNPGVNAMLLYPLDDPDLTCGRGTKTTDSSNVTFCEIRLP